MLDRSGTSNSGEGRFVIVFCGRAFWSRELWAAGGADLTRSLNCGRLPEVGDGEETGFLEVFGASPYDRVFFDFLESMLSFTIAKRE